MRGLSQLEASEAFDLPRTYFSKSERGIATPRVSSLIRFAKIYDVSLYRLLGGEEIDPPPDPFMDEVRAALPELSPAQRLKLVATARRMCGPFLRTSLHGRMRMPS
jgi:transcriptional regulator with XRE-family HTH domain